MTAAVALFMSTVVIGGAAQQWPLGRLSDRMDRRKVIVLASLGAASAGVAMVVLARFWSRESSLPLSFSASSPFRFTRSASRT